MKKRRVILSFLVVAIGIMAVVFYWIRQEHGRSAHSRSHEASLPLFNADVGVEGLNYVQTKEGVAEWKLTASSARFLKNEKTAELDNVKVVFFAKDGRKIYMTSHKGFFNTESRDIQLQEDVIVSTEDGYVFKSPSVTYLAGKSEILSSQEVQFTGPQFEVKGTGMEVSVQNHTIKIFNNVSASIVSGFIKGANNS